MLVFGTLLFTLFAVFTILYISVQKKKQYHHKMEKQQMEHDFHKQLMLSQLEVQEQTLKDLSAELHDNIAQVLGMAKMQLHMLTDQDRHNKTMLKETTGLVAEAITDIRSMSHTMNGSYILKAGFKECIEKDLNRISSATRIKCNFKQTGEIFNIGEDRELMLFRIIQECVANAVKHGEPYSINVSLDYTPRALQVAIIDDGKGFEAGTQKSGGMGLDNIRERIRLLGGTAQIDSVVAKGTSVKLSIPVT